LENLTTLTGPFHCATALILATMQRNGFHGMGENGKWWCSVALLAYRDCEIRYLWMRFELIKLLSSCA